MAENESNEGKNIQKELMKKARQMQMIQIINDKKNEINLDENVENVEINYYEDFQYEIKGEIIDCSMLEIIKTPKQQDERLNPAKIRTYEIYIKSNENNFLILKIDENGNISLVEENIDKIDPKHEKKWIKKLQEEKDEKKEEVLEDDLENTLDESEEEKDNREKTNDNEEQEKKKQNFKTNSRMIKINTSDRKITKKEYFKDLVDVEKYTDIYIVQRK